MRLDHAINFGLIGTGKEGKARCKYCRLIYKVPTKKLQTPCCIPRLLKPQPDPQIPKPAARFPKFRSSYPILKPLIYYRTALMYRPLLVLAVVLACPRARDCQHQEAAAIQSPVYHRWVRIRTSRDLYSCRRSSQSAASTAPVPASTHRLCVRPLSCLHLPLLHPPTSSVSVFVRRSIHPSTQRSAHRSARRSAYHLMLDPPEPEGLVSLSTKGPWKNTL
jgi:hypothetical protein